MSDALFQALHHLARALLVSGALSEESVAEVALRVEADVTDGVLTLRIPVAETAAPRKVEVGTGGAGADTGPAALSA